MAAYKKSDPETAVNKQDHGQKRINENIADFSEDGRTGPLSVTNTFKRPENGSSGKKKGDNG